MSRPVVRAVVREVSARFPEAIVRTPVTISLALARAQHAAYVATLRDLGVEVTVLSRQDDWPDACFVEDTAVVLEGVALATRPGHPARRQEVPSVAAVLGRWLRVVPMERGTLDGGDVLAVGRTLYVGRSARTDDEGIDELRRVFPQARVVPVALRDGLHLKSSATAVPGGSVVCWAGGVAPGSFLHPVIPVGSLAEANVLAVGDTVVVPAGFPALRERLGRDHPLREVDNAELRKADSALTCLSILF